MKTEPGRMIRKSIARSHGVAALSPKALSLFCLIIPHFNSHGKMNGSPFFIKGECCPLIAWLDISTIKKCLDEISKETSVKWFTVDGVEYLHSLNWKRHQVLREDRLGDDLFPSFPDKSRSTPGQGRREG